MKVLAMVLFATMAAGAQSAKVVALKPEDAAFARKLHEARRLMDENEQLFHDKIVREYLVTTESHNGYNQSWPDPLDKEAAGTLTFWSYTANAGQFLTLNSAGQAVNGGEPRCDTPQEKAERKAQQAKIVAEQEAYEKAHPTKYLKEGWSNPGNYQLSEDFRYIVPSDKPTYVQPQNSIFATAGAQ